MMGDGARRIVEETKPRVSKMRVTRPKMVQNVGGAISDSMMKEWGQSV
jgi:hypothetical protein